MSFAIIETGGKQYKVSASKILEIEKLDAKVGDIVKIGFDPFRCHLFDNKGISFKNS